MSKWNETRYTFSLSSFGAQFALASYKSNLGPLNMKLSYVNFDVLANMAASASQCSCPLGMGCKQQLFGMTIFGINRV